MELHLHTKLCSMDGFCDPGEIVRTAHRMGHQAIAITDHGVVQGFPEAMLAADAIRKNDPDFKLIYGLEAYFVDDMVPVVYGAQAAGSLDGSFVVFDVETTGLNPDAGAAHRDRRGAGGERPGHRPASAPLSTRASPSRPGWWSSPASPTPW